MKERTTQSKGFVKKVNHAAYVLPILVCLFNKTTCTLNHFDPFLSQQDGEQRCSYHILELAYNRRHVHVI